MMLLSPYISFKAFYEYISIIHFKKPATYPFGAELMKILHSADIKYLSTYTNEILTIGIVFGVITLLVFLAFLAKSLLRLAQIGIVIIGGYFLYIFLKGLI